MGQRGPDQGVGYWLLKHGGFTVLASLGLLFLAAFALIKVTGFRQHHAPVAAVTYTDVPSTVDTPAAADPETSAAAVLPPASSAAPAPPSPSAAPSVLVSDNPAFDLTGSGDACRMHYFQDDQGRTVTLFSLTVDGELITHVSGPPGIGRHDEQFTRGVNRIVYDFPLSQAGDMGAVFYLPDGSSQSCTISAGSDTP